MSTSQNPNLQARNIPVNRPVIKMDDTNLPILAITVNHEGFSSNVVEIIPMAINGKDIYVFEGRRGEIIAKNHKVIEELINMGRLALFVNEDDKCSNSMDHCLLYNTPRLFYVYGRIRDVIKLPRGVRIGISDNSRFMWCTESKKVSELEDFLEKVGYDNYNYLAFTVAEGVDTIYVFTSTIPEYPVIMFNINIDNNMEELQGHLMFKKIDADVSIRDEKHYFRKSYVKIYNHEIMFRDVNNNNAKFPVTLFIPASVLGRRGVVYVVINNYGKPIRMTVKSNEHGETSKILEPNEVIILYHPSPSTSGID